LQFGIDSYPNGFRHSKRKDLDALSSLFDYGTTELRTS
jgi:hypothetical protein